MKLGVNIDHIATIRQARYRAMLDSPNAEPDPVDAAVAAVRGGADGITFHLRSDRRHIQDRDVVALRDRVTAKLNFELGSDPGILAIALRVRPEDACLVPETREEITTEGGLDCCANFNSVAEIVKTLRDAGIRVSLFIDPELRQVEAAVGMGAPCVELHTGAFANATGAAQDRELERLQTAATQAASSGLVVNAGHGINYSNVSRIRTISELHELNIGHSIVSRASFVGMERATAEMLEAMLAAR